MLKVISTGCIISLSLMACGGGSDSSTADTSQPAIQPSPVTYTGTFIDSPVQGLNYKTETQSGVTNANGEFIYQLNEKVTFSIGDIEFLETPVASVITPLTIFSTQDINKTEVVNMLRLLQTLDADGDAANGITLNDNIHALAANLTVDFASADFDSQVQQLVLDNNAVNISLISAAQAVMHFETTLGGSTGNEQSACGSDHPSVGFTGSFNTLAHDVTGDAEIIDNCTIAITNFNYDATAPAVYFYADNTDTSSIESFTLGDELRKDSVPYNNATIIVKLPNNHSLDDINTFSVWCVDFSVSFGDLIFTAP